MTHLFHGLRNPRNTGAPRAPLVCMEEAARNLGLKTRQSLQAMIQASEIPAPKPRMESVGRHKKNYYAMSDWRDWFAKAKGGCGVMALPRNDSVSRVIEFASTLGFTPKRTNGGHIKFSKPGRQPVFFGGSPSDRRAHLNAISNLKKSERGAAL